MVNYKRQTTNDKLPPTVVLWDIDNTLLYTGGAGSLGMTRAFRDLYGVDDAFGRVEFSGRTDTAIFRDCARANGFGDDVLDAEQRRFADTYIPHLERALIEVPRGHLMPGIAAILAALDARDDVMQGLGTGNFRRGAEIKLRHFGIDEYFPACVGGFGDDAEERAEVIRIGIERLRSGASGNTRIVIVGDTPHDVAAARANGAYALGVATGRDSVADLLAYGANAALDDLSDIERAIALICGS